MVLAEVVGQVELGELLCESLEDAPGSSLLRFAINANEVRLRMKCRSRHWHSSYFYGPEVLKVPQKAYLACLTTHRFFLGALKIYQQKVPRASLIKVCGTWLAHSSHHHSPLVATSLSRYRNVHDRPGACSVLLLVALSPCPRFGRAVAPSAARSTWMGT